MQPTSFTYHLQRSFEGQPLGLSLLLDLCHDRLYVDEVHDHFLHVTQGKVSLDSRSRLGRLPRGSYVVAVNRHTKITPMLRALKRDQTLSLEVLIPDQQHTSSASCSAIDLTRKQPGHLAFRSLFLSGGLFYTVSNFRWCMPHDGWDYLDVEQGRVVNVQPDNFRLGHAASLEFFVYAFYVKSDPAAKVFGWLPCSLLATLPLVANKTLEKLVDSPTRDILLTHVWDS